MHEVKFNNNYNVLSGRLLFRLKCFNLRDFIEHWQVLKLKIQVVRVKLEEQTIGS